MSQDLLYPTSYFQYRCIGHRLNVLEQWWTTYHLARVMMPPGKKGEWREVAQAPAFTQVEQTQFPKPEDAAPPLHHV